jgi:hypothetical protein
MPRWVHATLLIPGAAIVLLYGVLLSKLGWGVLIFGLIGSGFAVLLGRRIARRMTRRYPSL